MDAMTSGGHDCANCQMMTYSAYQLCPACSLELDQCQTCRQPANSGRGLRLKLQVGSARRKFAKAIQAAQAAHKLTLSPFQAEAAEFKASLATANQILELALRPTRAQVQPFADKVNELQKARADTTEAYAAFNRAHNEAKAVEEPFHLAYAASRQAAEAKFAAHRATYDAANRALDQEKRRAQDDFEAKVELLSASLTAKQRYDSSQEEDF